jgi:hypothetical protein
MMTKMSLLNEDERRRRLRESLKVVVVLVAEAKVLVMVVLHQGDPAARTWIDSIRFSANHNGYQLALCLDDTPNYMPGCVDRR